MNWGFAWRLSTLVSGLGMLVFAPRLLDIETLGLFYAIYSVSAGIAVVDLGLSNLIIVRGVASVISEKSNRIRNSVMVRFFLLLFLSSLYLLSLLSDSAVEGAISLALMLGVLFSLTYLAILYSSYIEGCVSSILAYQLRTTSEIAGGVGMVAGLLSGSGLTSIVGLFIGRAIVPLLHASFCSRAIESGHPVNEPESRFEIKLALVMIFGYFTSSGLPNIIFRLHGPEAGASFGQSYLLYSTLFSITMSIFLYKQNYIKHNISSREGGELYLFKKKNEIELVRFFAVASTLIIIGAALAPWFARNVIVFSVFESASLTLYFCFLINNHVVSIVYRMMGREITFALSMISNALIIISLWLSWALGAYSLFLVLLVLISVVINKLSTDSLLERNLVNGAK